MGYFIFLRYGRAIFDERTHFPPVPGHFSRVQNDFPPVPNDLFRRRYALSSFVDEGLKDSYSDLLYKVKVNQKETFLYLLFEHKSYPDKFTALQILKYMSAIWERFHTNHGGRLLPPILPLVLYHGKTVWSYGDRFSALIDSPEAFPPKKFAVFMLLPVAEWKDENVKL